ncbi:transporter substrate-binding domain-containing protein [Aliiglaciecola sp. LCG003]|uniref:substrate-binding periplasmic protein n=1 Tax=Aliiglaciecola sp. LCG003 TaxID=3053655 RepID=UPI002573483A|nr:transporter substrate-binding domain-containing protein [Aliiglaciecola sp. LCG003]WJG08156.1 transporter substrate-binding domain-containing protein [Aliiglaciecola sp. LCG003]
MRPLLFLFLLVSLQVNGNEKILNVAVNIGPPWAYFDKNKGVTGIDVEIIRRIFAKHGFTTEFHLLAYSRLIKEFNQGKFDFASPAAFAPDNGYLTSKYLPFKDVVVSLKRRGLTVAKLSDLTGKSIAAYQHATVVLGAEYAKTVESTNYLEFAEREVPMTLLVHDRSDVVIGERRLLEYIQNNLYPQDEIVIHPIFASVSYGAIAKEQGIQQLFDKALKEMIESGEYQEILAMWP